MRAVFTSLLILLSCCSFSQTWKELNDSISHFYDTGEYEKGREVAEKALGIAKKEFGERHQRYATSLNNLAGFYSNLGQYKKAEPLLLQAKEIYKDALGQDHPNYSACLNNLGDLYMAVGQYEKAEFFFIAAKEIRKKTPGESHPEYAQSLNNLGVLYQELGQYDKAEAHYIQSKEIRKKTLGELHPEYAQSLSNLATLYKTIGLYDKAETYLIESKEIKKRTLGDSHPDYSISLINLAELYKALGQYKKAAPLYMESLEIWKKAMGKTHPGYAKILIEVAELFEIHDQYDRAEVLYKEAMEIYRNSFGEKHADYARSLNDIAGLYSKMGQYEKAESLYVESLEVYRSIFGDIHPQLATILNNLIALYKAMGLYENAEPVMLLHSKVIVEEIKKSFSILSEKEKENYLANTISLVETNNSFVYGYGKASASILEDNFNLQLFFKSLMLEDSRSMIAYINKTEDSSLKQVFTEWMIRKELLARQYALSLDLRMQNLAALETETENIEKELTRRSSLFRKQQQGLQVSMRDIQRKIQPDEAVIEFVSFRFLSKKWTDSIIYGAYILKRTDTIPVFVPLFEEKQLQQLFDSAGKWTTTMVNSFYRGFKVKNKNSPELGKALYQLVWQPLEPHLKNVRKISYSPAGRLYSIAFHALPVDDTKLLMDRYQLQQYTSTRQVAVRNPEDQNATPKNIMLFGNASFTMDSLELSKHKKKLTGKATTIFPDYTQQNRNSDTKIWINLPGTAAEVKKIKLLFDQNKRPASSFTREAASEENLKSISGHSAQILHIATHGFFLPAPENKIQERTGKANAYTLADDPLLRSGLVLAGGNYAWSGKTPVEGTEDGIVTAYEISQLNLSNTELVVLSACETALGDVKGSEGVFGLQRAFKMAGVKKMIVSLWDVPDKETVELMTIFYTNWMNGKTIDQAFARAQAELRKKYSPYYWAAFVLIE